MTIATYIVHHGLQGAAAEYGFPYCVIGEMKSLDRREIEGYQSLKGLMEQYARRPADRPLCLASFGPPGSGKSRGIKVLAKHLAEIGDEIDRNVLEFNLSGFTDVSGLNHALHKSRDCALTQRTPIVLLDEFDCNFEQRPLGWLKYLLAPMQDGKFREGDSIYNVGRAILVFIGGTRRTFEDFAGQMRNREFIDAKGPDFVSRLRGHVNVRGINPADDGDALYVVRRAMAVRDFLENKLGKDFDEKDIDPSLLRALLKVDQYHHGVRSLEQIIAMCDTHSPLGQLTRTSLPQREQLDMHVDAAKFWDMLRSEEQSQSAENTLAGAACELTG